MKPHEATHPLLHNVQFVRGIGPRKAAALEQAGVRTVRDLLFYVPRRYLDRSHIVSIAQLRGMANAAASAPPEVRQEATVIGEVRSFRVVGTGRKGRLVVILADATGSMQLVWFGGVSYWKTRFHIGETLAVSGQPSSFGAVLQFVHPDIDRIASAGTEEGGEVDWRGRLNTGGLVPLYPSTQELSKVGLDSSGFRRLLAGVLEQHLSAVEETLPERLRALHNLVPLSDAVRGVHFPASPERLQEGLRRLKYEEFFLFQLKLALRRHWTDRENNGIRFNVKSALARRLVDALPFSLTAAQSRVIREIAADMDAAKPMNRLLQGDVGSGKTVVALVAMLIAVDNGYQAAVMAPTEILAEQHARTLGFLLRDLPVNLRLLVGAQRSAVRREVLEDIRRGSAQIVVGTHALFEEQVDFPRLGLVVIDEQHRFGVMQRASLRAKGMRPDVLVMTATPIPRTLSLTLYGDLDLSVINELPRGRTPIRTVVRHEEEKEEVYRFVREQVRAGRQAYFVYPLIEESEKLDLRAATVHFEELRRSVFPDLRLGLVHGRMDSAEKDRVMRAFADGALDILVATTVIEVGIDVPNATIMVIENAERFGLAQLHQLRGRVGRGEQQSTCILLTQRWRVQGMRRGRSTEADPDQQRLAERRLATMVQTTDGFRIAEVDLELRGPGDYFGTRQSGMPAFSVANIVTDGPLLEVARRDAFTVVEDDPQLRRDDHQALARHLRTFFREELELLHVG